MKGILVSMNDSKAETWSAPAVADSRAAAIRQMEMLVNADKATLISTHPEDFSLWEVATFDGCTVIACKPICLVSGNDVVRKDK